MKRKALFFTAAIAAVMLLGGCSGDFVSVPEATTQQADETASLDEFKEIFDYYYNDGVSTKETPTETTTPQPNFYSLYDLTEKEQINTDLDIVLEKRSLFKGKLSDLQIVSDKNITLPCDDLPLARASTFSLRHSKDSNYDKYIKDENTYFTVNDFITAYIITWNDIAIEMQHISNGKWRAKSKEVSYTIPELSINAFVGKHEFADGFLPKYDIVIDPAYMYGLPILTDGNINTEYEMNGVKFKADTLSLISKNYYGSLDKDFDGYVYATVKLKDFNVKYNSEKGYISTCVIEDIEIVNDDIKDVLEKPYVAPEIDTKDPEMAKTYNAILNNLDTLYNEKVNGINLIDLDFNGTPELLVSHNSKYSRGYPIINDVDVYCISDGELSLAGTLYNKASYGDGGRGNDLIRKGSEKVWYQISYCDRAKYGTDNDNENIIDEILYEMTLENGKLVFKEAVRLIYDNQENAVDGKLIYYGEPADVKVTHYEQPEGEDGPYVNVDYSFNGICAPWTMGVLKGYLMADMLNKEGNQSYELYSDFLYKWNKSEYEYVKLTIDKRSLSYQIAYIVDAFYLGEYDKGTKKNHYSFVGAMAKPVIYLYPETTTDVTVNVTLTDGELTATYPDYRDGWHVTAEPDGTLTDKADGRKHSYLYWEGEGTGEWDFSSGFCVHKDELILFLQEKLSILGLTDSEANEFIVYWLPIMQKNEYNIVSFQTTAYENAVKLDVTPAPDSELRVFMTFMKASEFTAIPEQELESFGRTGFCVVEWGGMECEN